MMQVKQSVPVWVFGDDFVTTYKHIKCSSCNTGWLEYFIYNYSWLRRDIIEEFFCKDCIARVKTKGVYNEKIIVRIVEPKEITYKYEMFIFTPPSLKSRKDINLSTAVMQLENETILDKTIAAKDPHFNKDNQFKSFNSHAMIDEKDRPLSELEVNGLLKEIKNSKPLLENSNQSLKLLSKPNPVGHGLCCKNCGHIIRLQPSTGKWHHYGLKRNESYDDYMTECYRSDCPCINPQPKPEQIEAKDDEMRKLPACD